jgi:hypothetical protein
MEIYRIVLVTITAALGLLALGLGSFILKPAVSSLHNSTRQERPRERQPHMKERV